MSEWTFTGQDRSDWPEWLKTHRTAYSASLWPADESLTHSRYRIPIIRFALEVVLPGDTIAHDSERTWVISRRTA